MIGSHIIRLCELDVLKVALVADFSQDDWLSNIEVLADGIYRIPIFNPEFLHRFADEIEQLELWAQQHQVSLQPPNSWMHDYGIEMRLIGIDMVLQHPQQRWRIESSWNSFQRSSR